MINTLGPIANEMLFVEEHLASTMSARGHKDTLGEADDFLKRFVLLRKRKGNSKLLFTLVPYFMGALETELLMLFISASYSRLASLKRSLVLRRVIIVNSH